MNTIFDTFKEQWNFVLYDTENKLVQLLLKESEPIVNEIEIQIEIEIDNDHATTGNAKRK